MVRVDLRQVRKFERDLAFMVPNALPVATRFTLNGMARKTQTVGRKIVKRNMILRNARTRQSIQFRSTKSLDIDRQVTRAGSTVDYMRVQEEGGVKVSGGKHGTPLTTTYASGEGRGKQVRRRLATKKRRLLNVTLRRRGRKRGRGRKQKNLIAVRRAAKGGRKDIFMNLGRRKGIFRIVGKGERIKVQMLHDLTKKTVRIPRSPWLGPAERFARKLGPEMFRDALEFQVRRHGLFRSG